MGTETVPGTKVCPGGNEWGSKYPCKHQPDTGSFVHYPALQLSFSDRMHFPGTETADWCILLSFLVKAHAKTELLQEERGTVAPGMCGRGKVPQKNTGSCARHRNAYGIVLHCNGNPAEHFYLLYRKVRKHFFRLLGQSPELRITQIIQKQQNESGIYWDSLAS